MVQVYTLTHHDKWEEDRSATTTPRVTPAHVTFNLPDVSGTSTVDYQMTYLPDGNASFIYTETVVVANFDGKKGSFITQGKGTWNGKEHKAEGTFEIVEGSGTDELKGIKGTGVQESSPYGYRFDVTF
ncbi:hypothetical protein JAAARDRAFT_35898 [Jaapia argillacea MUCL 33604]|uniref:DUF3224 domain-containing protein n=1 Tax=Jaapia argillacea MUCL 33604 TaxID=933084 RepID=A0A067PR27_9AGAM|nr:hypothetical protein JAAARDRAFT_35898 [Jaapia argillacea MUCL 33604]